MVLMKQCADDTSVFLDGSKMSLYNKHLPKTISDAKVALPEFSMFGLYTSHVTNSVLMVQCTAQTYL